MAGRQGIQPRRCSVCGSVWFREAMFLAPQSRLKDPLLVCLCGTVVTPQLSGIRPPADQDEVNRLLDALTSIRNLRQAITGAPVLAAASVGVTATLISQIARLEQSCQLIQRRLLPTAIAVKRSKPPRRVAATDSLDMIALELQRAGLDFRQARRVVWTVRDLWKTALIKGESIETPLGRLSTQKMPSGRRRFVLEGSPDPHPEVEVTRPE
jgi:hypothetical protein